MEMAQRAQCSLHRHEDLRPEPQHPVKEPDAGVHACDPRAGEAETGGSLLLANKPI